MGVQIPSQISFQKTVKRLLWYNILYSNWNEANLP